MYINPIIIGIAGTILVEVVAVLIAAIITTRKSK